MGVGQISNGSTLFIMVLTTWLALKATAEVCKTDGDIVCNEDCSQIVQCFADSDTFIEVPLELCSTNKYCYKADEELSCQYHSACKDPALVPFQCTAQAIFPDPYNCNRFYMCTPNEDGTGFDASLKKCPDAVAYDYHHRYCNIPITEQGPPSCIDGPVPFCLDLGQSGPLAEDDNIYYVCHREALTLYPVLYQCPTGGVYNMTSLGCDL